MASWELQPPYGKDGADDFAPKFNAKCFCGRVKFQVSSDPVAAKICDCSTCMRLHGAPMQWAALFQKASVRFSPDSTSYLRWYNTSNDTVYTDGAARELPCKLQCRHCGTWVADEGRNMFMAFPTLFEFVKAGDRPQFPPAFLPTCHIFCATRALEFEDGLPSFLDDRKTPVSMTDYMLDIAPCLDGRGHKGQAGRIGVLGGSVDFAGAPYYAGMSALRVGAELLYLCTAEEATGPIKSYSPELMVSSVYRWERMSSSDESIVAAEQDQMVAKMEALLPRFHALVIGPGLGRDDRVLAAVARVIEAARKRSLPLVIDADGLWLIERRPDLVASYDGAVLTPNVAEYRRLAKAVLGDEKAPLAELCKKLSGPIIVQKGRVDLICSPSGEECLECSEEGAPRRPGGLGDFLSGSMAVFLGWAVLARQNKLRACQAACTLVRRACRAAFSANKRAMVAPDVLDYVGAAFEELCPACPLSRNEAGAVQASRF
eukprot:TRINITY_DN10539_c1_g3_i1.p1 TRINITY_DN10539_c1_g3~~TRINITY_DN10539_c1_g3_i1.p1  ORF type:complete len:505 (+),score=67.68 TRINITY_DN10539_c1_g3_i1:53-1516(+)